MSDAFEGRVGIVVPTYNAGPSWPEWLSRLADQKCTITKTLIVDSSSQDNTATLAAAAGLDVRVIAKEEFNHGGTRQAAVSWLGEVDVVVFLTQDALLANQNSISHILAPFSDPQVGAVCARQLPHKGASPLAAHARGFNYPSQGCVKSLADAAWLGLKTAFLSNSFAAYRGSALDEIGGFPADVIMAEDMYVAARMLSKGWKIAYSAQAMCFHSHNYSLKQELQRYFDTGVFHAREPWIRELLGGAGGEGVRYVLSELKYLGLRRLHWWPIALANNAMKLLGYKLGKLERFIPIALKRRLSMHSGFWNELP